MQSVKSAFDCFSIPKFCEYLGLTCKEDIHITSVEVSKGISIIEAPKEEKPPGGIVFIYLEEEVRTVGYPRNLFEYKVQIFCKTREFGFNILFYVGMIVTKNVKSVEYVDVELLQKYIIGISTIIPSDIGAKHRIKIT